MKQLAIVIPAYKATFLRATLDSIVAQTCQDFTLYIGDDSSPYQLGDIVDEYRSKIDLLYHRFETNLGGKDLVAQWERCIAMSQGEPYIWLFSDDDVMEPRCVETFLSLPEEIRDNYIVHFNIHQIDEKGTIEKTPPLYPPKLSAKEYLDKKLFKPYLISYVVEFVYPRWVYEKTGGFQNFDMAWGSDFITWIKFADACNGIYTIDGNQTKVRWRSSNENISPNKSHDILIRKLLSQIDYTAYFVDFLKKHGYDVPFKYVRYVWGYLYRNTRFIGIEDLKEIKKMYSVKIGFTLASCIAYYFIKLKLQLQT